MRCGVEFRHIDPAAARIVLVRRAQEFCRPSPKASPPTPPDFCARYGVEVMSGAMVVDIDATGVNSSAGRSRRDRRVGRRSAGGALAAGCRASTTGQDGNGWARICLCQAIPMFSSSAMAQRRPPMPRPSGIAPAAKQMGAYVGRVIARPAVRPPAPPAFRYRHAGDLATIGRGAAVVSLARWSSPG